MNVTRLWFADRRCKARLPARGVFASAACTYFGLIPAKLPALRLSASHGLRADCADRVTAAAIVVGDPVPIARIEVQVTRAVRIKVKAHFD